MINLYGGKYHVTQISYHNYTIRVVDPAHKKGNCLISSPLHSIDAYPDLFSLTESNTIVLMNCEQSINDKYIPIIPFNTTIYSSSSPTYAYAVVGEYLFLEDIPYSCTIGTYMVIQRLKAVPEPSNLSMSDLQGDLLLGLHLSFLSHFCTRHCEMKGQICLRMPFNARSRGTNVFRTLQRKVGLGSL